MYKKRLRTYKKLGYELGTSENTNDTAGRIVNASDYQPLFANDLETTSKSIFISAPYLNKKRLGHLKPVLEAAVLRGVAVTVIVSKPTKEDYVRQFEEEIATLGAIGCAVIISAGHPSALAIIDERIVWYGTLPLLAFPKADDCSLRFESSEMAFDLIQANGL